MWLHGMARDSWQLLAEPLDGNADEGKPSGIRYLSEEGGRSPQIDGTLSPILAWWYQSSKTTAEALFSAGPQRAKSLSSIGW